MSSRIDNKAELNRLVTEIREDWNKKTEEDFQAVRDDVFEKMMKLPAHLRNVLLAWLTVVFFRDE